MTARIAFASRRLRTAGRLVLLTGFVSSMLLALSGYANSGQGAGGDSTPADSNQRAAILAFEGYNQALVERSYVTLRDRFLHVPFVIVDGASRVIPSVETVVAGLRARRESLEAAGYETTRIEVPRVSLLANDRLLLHARLHHRKKDGSLLEEQANIYLMVRVADIWKVGGIIPQDAAKVER